MAKTFSGREIIKILEREFGFIIVDQKGSHIKLKKKIPSRTFITVVPLHKELATGTLRGVLRLAGIEYREFIKIK